MYRVSAVPVCIVFCVFVCVFFVCVIGRLCVACVRTHLLLYSFHFLPPSLSPSPPSAQHIICASMASLASLEFSAVSPLSRHAYPPTTVGAPRSSLVWSGAPLSSAVFVLQFCFGVGVARVVLSKINDKAPLLPIAAVLAYVGPIRPVATQVDCVISLTMCVRYLCCVSLLRCGIYDGTVRCLHRFSFHFFSHRLPFLLRLRLRLLL